MTNDNLPGSATRHEGVELATLLFRVTSSIDDHVWIPRFLGAEMPWVSAGSHAGGVFVRGFHSDVGACGLHRVNHASLDHRGLCLELIHSPVEFFLELGLQLRSLLLDELLDVSIGLRLDFGLDFLTQFGLSDSAVNLALLLQLVILKLFFQFFLGFDLLLNFDASEHQLRRNLVFGGEGRHLQGPFALRLGFHPFRDIEQAVGVIDH